MKPKIEYSNLEVLRDYLGDFLKKYDNAEDLLELDYNKCDSKVVNGVRLWLRPDLLKKDGSRNLGVNTSIETNLDTEWFAKSTKIEDELSSQYLNIDFNDPVVYLSTDICNGIVTPPYTVDMKQLEKGLMTNAREMNLVIDKMFNFYGINNFKEVPVNFDFQKMKEIRDKKFYR